jgi:MFS family permease
MAGMGTSPDGRSYLRPTHVRAGVLVLACTLSLLTYLDRVCISRVQKDIGDDLHIDAVGMGWVFGAFALGYALFEVPGGLMGDYWGTRRVLTRIVLVWSLFTALTGVIDLAVGWAFGFDVLTQPVVLFGFLTTTVVVLVMVVVRFAFGCGEAGAYPNLARVTRTWSPERERGLAQGAIWFSARMGGALAFLTIGTLTTWLGWRWAFCVLGLAGVVWCVFFNVWFRNTPQEKPECNEAERDLIRGGPAVVPGLPPPLPPDVPPARTGPRSASDAIARPQPEAVARLDPPPAALPTDAPVAPTAEESSGHGLPPLEAMLSSLTLWAMSLSAFCVSLGWYFYPSWQPRYLDEVFGISYKGSELIAGLPFLCGALGSLAGGGLSDWLVRALRSRRWGRSLIGLFGFGGAGACVLATGYVTQAWQAVVLLCLAFLVNDLAIPVLWAVSADVAGRYVGTVSGVMNMVGGIGAFLSMILTPYLMLLLPTEYAAADRWRLVFAVLAGAWFVAAVSWVFINAGKPLFADH